MKKIKSFVPGFFKVSITYLITLSLEKEIIVWKKSRKSCEVIYPKRHIVFHLISRQREVG